MDSLNKKTKDKTYSFYKAVYLNVTNKPEASLRQLKSKQNSSLQSTFDYVKLLNDNAVKTFNYPIANKTSKQLISTYKTNLNETELLDEINNQRIWETLENIPPQTISTFKEIKINSQKDLAGLTTIEVKNNNLSSNFVFDTGAGLNYITASQAELLGIKIQPDNNIEVESFTGQKNKVRVGVAETLSLGDITIKNSVF